MAAFSQGSRRTVWLSDPRRNAGLKSSSKLLLALTAALSLIVAAPAGSIGAQSSRGAGEVVVADRASGTISVIDAGSDQLRGEVTVGLDPFGIAYVP